ncbi:very-long-chain enoyl-CoA reductase isoform 4-T5 [Spinachia spinachia]
MPRKNHSETRKSYRIYLLGLLPRCTSKILVLSWVGPWCFLLSALGHFSPTSSSISEYHTFTHTNMPLPPVLILLSAFACHTFHYMKRLIETIFVHRFSHGTMPLRTIVRNCVYYWGFSAWLAYYINHPLYTPPSYGELQVNYALVIFVVRLVVFTQDQLRSSTHECLTIRCEFLILMQMCELGNFSIHLTLNNLRGEGSRSRRFPEPTTNPFTWLFIFVSCPNYTYELGAWVGFSIMTQCLPVAFYTLLGFIQMTIWAKGKHRAYSREFKDYPTLRMAIIPLIL